MTINELYKQGTAFLENAKKENTGFDARCLMEFALNVNTTSFMLMRDKKADASLNARYMTLIRRRITGEPLQYILGSWEFMGNTFYVGNGVLIPRPETELLVDYAVNFLKNRIKPIIFDLCSGSGCIAISVAKLYPNSIVYAVEKSDMAFNYLEKNIKLNKVKNVKALKEDVFNFSLLSNIKPDLILSNPPYVKSADINMLQVEVQNEPIMALDGGNDGYDFYHILCSNWFNRLPKGAAMAVECGEEQADEISQMLYLCHARVGVIEDLSGFPRVVTAIK